MGRNFAFAKRERLDSILLSFGANMSVLQGSLYVTDRCFASLSHGVTMLYQALNAISRILPISKTVHRFHIDTHSRRSL